MNEIERPLRERLLRASTAVYLATEEGPAKQISELLREAERRITQLEQALDLQQRKEQHENRVLELRERITQLEQERTEIRREASAVRINNGWGQGHAVNLAEFILRASK